MNAVRIIGIVILGLTMAGCDKFYEQINANNPQTKEIKNLKSQVVALQKMMGKLQTNVGSNTIFRTYSRDAIVHLNSLADISLDPADPSFNTYSNGWMHLAVSVKKVLPSADGTKVYMDFGNLDATNYVGIKVSLKYGVRAPKGKDFQKEMKWYSALEQTTSDLTCTLYSGRWNPCPVTLSGIKPDELGYIEITGIKYKEITMH